MIRRPPTKISLQSSEIEELKAQRQKAMQESANEQQQQQQQARENNTTFEQQQQQSEQQARDTANIEEQRIRQG